jgi:hypothetical protein
MGRILGVCFFLCVLTTLGHCNWLVEMSLLGTRTSMHALVGGAHVNESELGVAGGNTSFADALGGGVDYQFLPRMGWRVQVDALQTRFFSSSQTNVRISTGIAFRF